MNDSRIVLPPDYYIRDFELVIHSVRERYDALLREAERRSLDVFSGLPEPAKRIFVRMHSRQGPWFRGDALVYPEIDDVPGALETLVTHGFALGPDAATVANLVPLLRKDEIAETLARFSIRHSKGARRNELEELLVASVPEAHLAEPLRARLSPVSPTHAELIELLFFFFFGNGEQGLTDFVLTGIGMVRYEEYRIFPEARLFSAREDVDFLLEMAHHRATLEEIAHDAEALAAFHAQVVARQNHPGLRQQRRYMRLLNELGRSWERLGHPLEALACYQGSTLPPARERRTRLHLAAGDSAAASTLAMEIATEPRSTAEESFARGFLRRQAKKCPLARAWAESHPPESPVPEVRLTVRRIGRIGVEATALALAAEQGWNGFFTENVLWNGLFGLAFWDVIFAPLPGAFEHPFQDAPLDMASPDFFARRKELCLTTLEELRTGSSSGQILLERFDRKFGIANRFVSWRWLTRDHLQAALSSIPPQALLAVLDVMMRNPIEFSSGFPDLFLFRAPSADENSQEGRCELWEVKGPNDSLRPEQERWLRLFNAHGLPARVAWVAVVP